MLFWLVWFLFGGRYGFGFCWLVYALFCLLVFSDGFFGIAGFGGFFFFTVRVLKHRLPKIAVKTPSLEIFNT